MALNSTPLLVGYQTDTASSLLQPVEIQGFHRSNQSTAVSSGNLTPLHYDGSAHLMTVAPTGTGKGRSVVIPTLLTYPGAVVVLDPKGENYQVTARARREMGQQVIRLDPFSTCGPGGRFAQSDGRVRSAQCEPRNRGSTNGRTVFAG